MSDKVCDNLYRLKIRPLCFPFEHFQARKKANDDFKKKEDRHKKTSFLVVNCPLGNSFTRRC